MEQLYMAHQHQTMPGFPLPLICCFAFKMQGHCFPQNRSQQPVHLLQKVRLKFQPTVSGNNFNQSGIKNSQEKEDA